MSTDWRLLPTVMADAGEGEEPPDTLQTISESSARKGAWINPFTVAASRSQRRRLSDLSRGRLVMEESPSGSLLRGDLVRESSDSLGQESTRRRSDSAGRGQ